MEFFDTWQTIFWILINVTNLKYVVAKTKTCYTSISVYASTVVVGIEVPTSVWYHEPTLEVGIVLPATFHTPSATASTLEVDLDAILHVVVQPPKVSSPITWFPKRTHKESFNDFNQQAWRENLFVKKTYSSDLKKLPKKFQQFDTRTIPCSIYFSMK